MTPRIKIEIVTLFPGWFDSVIKESIIGRGRTKRLFDIDIIDLREYTSDRHRTADDKPFGGGGGMVLKVEPLYNCLKALGYEKDPKPGERLVLTSAAGKKFTQSLAVEFSLLERLTIICGHYLGVDERILALFAIEEISIGDYVMTGGEAAAAVILDAVTRLVPGVLGNFESALEDSHSEGLLGTPVYTRPEEFLNLRVPEPLVTGNHKEIKNFRRLEALRKTWENRPELLTGMEMDKKEKAFLDKLKKAKKENNKE
ncbi:tRNA (guanine-1-)-methyltransferase [Candidatus Zixiibacteriota bacterium]|nr:tRNA (guanine-1-)-methyltransferase [candidate division Zixibacteria bacterium]